MELSELMKNFGAEMGLTKLAPDGDGIYRLAIDDRAVSLAEADSGRMLVVWAAICELPTDGRETLFRLLLEEMFMAQGTGGAFFAVEPKENVLYLQRIDALAAMDYDFFKSVFEQFINICDHWEKLIAGFNPLAAQLESAKKEADAAVGRLGDSGFMMV